MTKIFNVLVHCRHGGHLNESGLHGGIIRFSDFKMRWAQWMVDGGRDGGWWWWTFKILWLTWYGGIIRF